VGKVEIVFNSIRFGEQWLPQPPWKDLRSSEADPLDWVIEMSTKKARNGSSSALRVLFILGQNEETVLDLFTWVHEIRQKIYLDIHNEKGRSVFSRYPSRRSNWFHHLSIQSPVSASRPPAATPSPAIFLTNAVDEI
jgi:hypothetical protein